MEYFNYKTENLSLIDCLNSQSIKPKEFMKVIPFVSFIAVNLLNLIFLSQIKNKLTIYLCIDG